MSEPSLPRGQTACAGLLDKSYVVCPFLSKHDTELNNKLMDVYKNPIIILLCIFQYSVVQVCIKAPAAHCM